jgi:hypothetical protein
MRYFLLFGFMNECEKGCLVGSRSITVDEERKKKRQRSNTKRCNCSSQVAIEVVVHQVHEHEDDRHFVRHSFHC